MAIKPSPYTFINDTEGLPNTANVVYTQQNANNTNTLVATYLQNNLDNNPQLQILNSAGGATGQLQFNNGRGFGGSSNLTYTESTSRLQLRGNLYVTGNLFANIQTNLNNFHLSGGANGQLLTTDGAGNVSWVDPDPNVSGAIFNGNSNVIVRDNGNITFSSNGVANVVTISSSEVNLGNVSKIKISGGNANNYLTTDGTGNLFWADDIPVTISNVAPNLPAGHLWFDSDEGRGYIKYSNSWVDFSPAVLPNPDMYANTISFPDGSLLTTANGIGYSNSNVAAYLTTYTGNISANYFIGNGASLTGTIANASHASTANTVTTAAQPNISSLGTLSFLSVAGNVNALGNMHAAFFKGNGSQLTGITVSTAATVTTNAQPNITSVGNLSSLSVTGNIRTGNIIITSNVDAISPTSGSIQSSGGIGVQGNIVGNNHLYIGPSASSTAFVNPVIIGKHVGDDYIQAAIVNSSETGSSDWAAYGDNGTDSGGWSDMGFTSSNFADPTYTVTGPNDGYFFVQAAAGSYGGNLVIATGDNGTTNDIIFATGGFQTGNIFGRINHTTQTLEIPAGKISVAGNISSNGIVSANTITLTGTATAVNASSGNILTNEVTGTKFNFLNGSYTATLTAQASTSNYSLSLPSNVGTSGQTLTSDGAGNLVWYSAKTTTLFNVLEPTLQVENFRAGLNSTGYAYIRTVSGPTTMSWSTEFKIWNVGTSSFDVSQGGGNSVPISTSNIQLSMSTAFGRNYDTVTGLFSDESNGRTYRVTWICGPSGINYGTIIIEKLL